MVDFAGGLLSVLGSGAAGGFKAMGENASEKMKQEAIDLRDKNLARLEEKKYQRRKGEEQVEYGRRVSESDKKTELGIQREETAYQRRKGEDETTYQRREAKRLADEAKYTSVQKVTDEEGNESILGVTKDGVPEVIYSGGKKVSAQSDKVKSDIIKEAFRMVNEDGASLSNVNYFLEQSGLPKWVDIPTGEVKETGGFLGFGTTKTPVTKPGPGGASPGVSGGSDLRSMIERLNQLGTKSTETGQENQKGLMSSAEISQEELDYGKSRRGAPEELTERDKWVQGNRQRAAERVSDIWNYKGLLGSRTQ